MLPTESTADEEGSSESECEASGGLSGAAIAMLLLSIVEAVAVVVLAKRLLALKRKQRDKTAGEGGGEAAKGEEMFHYSILFY